MKVHFLRIFLSLVLGCQSLQVVGASDDSKQVLKKAQERFVQVQNTGNLNEFDDFLNPEEKSYLISRIQDPEVRRNLKFEQTGDTLKIIFKDETVVIKMAKDSTFLINGKSWTPKPYLSLNENLSEIQKLIKASDHAGLFQFSFLPQAHAMPPLLGPALFVYGVIGFAMLFGCALGTAATADRDPVYCVLDAALWPRWIFAQITGSHAFGQTPTLRAVSDLHLSCSQNNPKVEMSLEGGLKYAETTNAKGEKIISYTRGKETKSANFDSNWNLIPSSSSPSLKIGTKEIDSFKSFEKTCANKKLVADMNLYLKSKSTAGVPQLPAPPSGVTGSGAPH